MATQSNLNSPKTISISPKKVAITLALFWSAIVFYGTISQISRLLFSHYLPLFNAFDLDGEMNVPAIFSGLMLLISSLLLFIIWRLERSDSNAKYWMILSLGFFIMANDEVFQIHEATSKLVTRYSHLAPHGIFTYSWVVPYSAVCIILGIFFVKFLRSLPRATALKLLISGFVYLAAVIGMEMIGGTYADNDTHGFNDSTYISIMLVEEACEMYAISYFIYTLLQYIQQVHRGLTIKMENNK